MDRLMALITFVLSLFGCDTGASTFVHRVRADGAELLHSRVTLEAGVARFDCLGAGTRCRFAIDTGACLPAPAKAADCEASAVRFALAPGESRQITGVHAARVCVSTEDGTAGECARLGPGSGSGR